MLAGLQEGQDVIKNEKSRVMEEACDIEMLTCQLLKVKTWLFWHGKNKNDGY